MFYDLMLKFADEGEAKDHLYEVQVDADGMAIGSTPKYTAIDMIGTIYEPAPDPLPEDYQPVPYPGYHVNVRNTAEMPELASFVVTPSPATPLRVWA